ncbi:hypothetical protein BC831DRAFT_444740 [Entophlyctis helioformis]|nr:hypothetical protein BC831DRAFT_444740 [Entophlyctis helioformis]
MIALAALALASALVSGVSAQTCAGNPTFTECVRNSLVSPTGLVGAAIPEDACRTLQQDQTAYYTCLCARYQSVVGCYTSFCAADPGLFSAQQSSTQYCGAVAALPSPSTIPGASATQGAGLPPLPSLSPAAPSVASPTTSPKTGSGSTTTGTGSSSAMSLGGSGVMAGLIGASVAAAIALGSL